MENAASVLVLVVHPDEETIGFSSVGAGALAPYRRVYTHSPFEAHLHLGTLCYLTALPRPLSLTGNALYASQTETGIHNVSAVVSHGSKALPVQSNMS
jgi:hypothetical protein